MTDYAIQQIVNALSAGSLYALMAVGLAMVFGILRLINFAHGDVMMIAAYLAASALGAGLPLEQAVILSWSSGRSPSGCSWSGSPTGRSAARPDVAMLLTSFAVGQILQNGTLLTTRLAGKPTLIAFPSPEAAERRHHDRGDHVPEGQRGQLRRRDRPPRPPQRCS